jgi:hypothetical protein
MSSDESRHARALHLYDDLLTTSQPREVDLRDRGGSDRCFIELREELLERTTEVFLDDSADGGERLRRHLVAALFELVYQFRREEALA